MLYLDVNAIGTQGAAAIATVLCAITTPTVVDFKVHSTGEVFGSHGLQTNTDTLLGFEIIFAVFIAGVGFAILVEIAILAIVKTDKPLALGFEINGVAFLYSLNNFEIY